MEVQEPPITARKKPELTPKALIHQKYGSKACYTIEEVQQHTDGSCPGLAIPQQSRVLYHCCLVLPELSVTSDAFAKKKDAEQSAAKMAIEKLGIQSAANDLTPEEAFDELVFRVSILFSDEFLSSSHPLVGHFKVAMGQVGDHYSRIPLPVIAACDVKVNTLCKIICPKAESDPLFISSLIWKAARMSRSVCTTSAGEFWIWKCNPYSPQALESLMARAIASIDSVHIKALCIPGSCKEDIETISLAVSGKQYYMDEIAQKLGARDASQLLVSRTVGKSSSEMKFYFMAPEAALESSYASLEPLPNADKCSKQKPLLNKRASYLSGQNIYGDAILANVGYTRKSPDIFYDDVSLCTYYRMLLGKLPDGHYKLSREAILAAELPTAFTSRSNWKGPFPKELLCVFCRQHQFLEPLFSVKNSDSCQAPQSGACKKPELPELPGESEMTNGHMQSAKDWNLDKVCTFKSEVKIFSRSRDLILECTSDHTYKKEADAVQDISLKVLNWFNKYFKQLNMPVENLSSFGLADNIIVHPQNFSQEFAMLASLCNGKQKTMPEKCSSRKLVNGDQPDLKQESGMNIINVEGDESAVFPSPGSLTCINYAISLARQEGDPMKEVIESKEEFEFEVGTGAVTNQLEACVCQLSISQAAQFVTSLPSRDLLLAAAGGSAENLANMSLSNCFLEYSLKVLRVTEPLEERMEQALFSPPLSKQRVEFAVTHINDSHSTSLVDFGCGSGSLLDSLLQHSTTLERIAGVDISCKGLTRAAKLIHSKLSKSSLLQDSIRSAVLYDGSITNFDSRLYGFDIGTCLEVIEHMEEDQACLFAHIALSSFCPRVLIVSTPNYEYNPILQRSTLPNKEEESEEKPGTCKFRNHDHKFEWTRQQFEQWATDLAERHNYSVEFSGVGGCGDVEPGFASQIAVFRRSLQVENYLTSKESYHPYRIVWEWNSNSSLLA